MSRMQAWKQTARTNTKNAFPPNLLPRHAASFLQLASHQGTCGQEGTGSSGFVAMMGLLSTKQVMLLLFS